MEKTVAAKTTKLPPGHQNGSPDDSDDDDGALPLIRPAARVRACPPSLPLSEHKVLTDKQNAQIILDQRISGDQ